MKESIALEMLPRLPSKDTISRAQTILEDRFCIRVQAMRDAERQRDREVEVVVERRRELATAEAALKQSKDKLKAARENVLSNIQTVKQRRHRAERADQAAQKAQTAKATKAAQSALAKVREVEEQALAAAVEFADQWFHLERPAPGPLVDLHAQTARRSE